MLGPELVVVSEFLQLGLREWLARVEGPPVRDLAEKFQVASARALDCVGLISQNLLEKLTKLGLLDSDLSVLLIGICEGTCVTYLELRRGCLCRAHC